MKHIRKRILASFLALTLVVSMGNGFGPTYVYASENTESVPKNVQIEQSAKEAFVKSINVADDTVKANSFPAKSTPVNGNITQSGDYDEDIESDVTINGEGIEVNFHDLTITGNVTILNGIVNFNKVTVAGNVTVKAGTVTLTESNVNKTLSAEGASDTATITAKDCYVKKVTDIDTLTLKNHLCADQFSDVDTLNVESAYIEINVDGDNPVAPVFHDITGDTYVTLQMNVKDTGEIPKNDDKPVLPIFTGTINLGFYEEQIKIDGEYYTLLFNDQNTAYIRYNDKYYLKEDFSDVGNDNYTIKPSAAMQNISNDDVWPHQWNKHVSIQYARLKEDRSVDSYVDLSQITTPYVEFDSKQVAAKLIAGASPYIRPEMHCESEDNYRTDMDGSIYIDCNQVIVTRYIDNPDNTAEQFFKNDWHKEGDWYSNYVGMVGSVKGAIAFMEADLLGEGASAPYYCIYCYSKQTVDIDVSALTALKGVRIVNEYYNPEQNENVYYDTDFIKVGTSKGQVIEFCRAVSEESNTAITLSGEGEVSFVDCRINRKIIGDNQVTVATYGNTAFKYLESVNTIAFANNIYLTEGMSLVNKVELRDNANIFVGSDGVVDLNNVYSLKSTISDNSKGQPVTVEDIGYDFRLYVFDDGTDMSTAKLDGNYDQGKGWNTYWDWVDGNNIGKRVYYKEIPRQDGGSDRECYVYDNGAWHYYDGVIKEEATDLDVSSLQPDVYTQGVEINYYNNKELDVFNPDRNLWELQNQEFSSTVRNHDIKAFGINQNTLESIDYNLRIRIGDNAEYHFTDQVYWNDTRIVHKDPDGAKLFAVDYSTNEVSNYFATVYDPNDYEGVAITKEQYEEYKESGNIELEGDRKNGSLSDVLSALSGSEYIYIRGKLGLNINSLPITIPEDAHVVINCGDNPGEISNISLGENAECILGGTYNGDIQYNGSTGSKLILKDAIVNGVITGNNVGSLSIHRGNQIYGCKDIDEFVVTPDCDLRVVPRDDGVYEPVVFNKITGVGELRLFYRGYPENTDDNGGKVAELPQFNGSIELGLEGRMFDGQFYTVYYYNENDNEYRYVYKDGAYHLINTIKNEQGNDEEVLSDDEADVEGKNLETRNSRVSFGFIEPDSFDHEWRDMDLAIGTKVVKFANNVALPLLMKERINYCSSNDLHVDLDGALMSWDNPVAIFNTIKEDEFNDYGYGNERFKTNALDLLVKALSSLDKGYYRINLRQDNINLGDITVPENVTGLILDGYWNERTQNNGTVEIGDITIASGSGLNMSGIKCMSQDNDFIDIRHTGNVNNYAMVTLRECRFKKSISCYSYVQMTIRDDNVVSYLMCESSMILQGNLYVDFVLHVQELRLKDNAQLFLASRSIVSIVSAVVNEASEHTDAMTNKKVFTKPGLNFFYEYEKDDKGNAFYPTVNLMTSIVLDESANLYWYDSNPNDEDNNKDKCVSVYYEEKTANKETIRTEYVHLADNWYVLKDDKLTPCEDGFDGTKLQTSMYKPELKINVYNSFKEDDDAVYENSYNMHEAQDRLANSSDCTLGRMLTTDYQEILRNCRNFRVEFADVFWYFDLSRYHNRKEFIEKEDDRAKIHLYDEDYNNKLGAYIETYNPLSYIAYKLDENQYNNFVQDHDYCSGEPLGAGELDDICMRYSPETYLLIQQIFDTKEATDLIVPGGCHYIYSTEQQVTGKLGTVTVHGGGSLALEGNFEGNMQYMGHDNFTDTGDDDTQLILRNVYMNGTITGNQRGILNLVGGNTLCGLSDILVCNLLSSDHLDIIPNQDGTYEKVSFGNVCGETYFQLCYSGYPESLVPEFTGDIDLGLERVCTADGTEYDAWFGENDERYICKDNVYYLIEDDTSNPGRISIGDEATGITTEDVWNNTNCINVTYYTPDSFDGDSREVQNLQLEDLQYMTFDTMEHGFELLHQGKLANWDYSDYYIDIDGKLQKRDQSQISVFGVDEENFRKVGYEGWFGYEMIPTASSENAKVIIKGAKFDYSVIVVEISDQNFTDLVVQEDVKGLAIVSGRKDERFLSYNIDSVTLHDDQEMLFDRLRTENEDPLDISMANEGTSGTVRFIESRVNQVVNGTKDVTVKAEGNNAFKALTNFKQLIVNGEYITIEDALNHIGSIHVTADSFSTLIAKSKATIVLPAITGDKNYTEFNGVKVPHQSSLNIFAEQKDSDRADITFTGNIERGSGWDTCTDDNNFTYYKYLDTDNKKYYAKMNNNTVEWYQMENDQLIPVTSVPQQLNAFCYDRLCDVIPYNYETSIDNGNMYGESNFDLDKAVENKVSYEDIEAKIFTVDKQIMLQQSPNALFKNLGLSYKDKYLLFDGEEEECFKKDGNELKFLGYDVNEDTGEFVTTKKYGFCDADYTAMWNGYSIDTIGNQTYTGSVITPEVCLSSTTSDFMLLQDTNYEVIYTNNTKTGKATVTVKGLGLFSNYPDKQAEFNIGQKNIADSTIKVASIANQVYTGKALTPTLAITDSACGNAILVKDTDYTVEYASNIGCGTATVTISGAGNYTGTLTKNFKITQRSISSSVITVASQTYSGTYIKPIPKVTLNINGTVVTLRYGTDFTVAHSKSINVGTGTVYVYGKGNYSGTKIAYFKIAPKTISSTISKISSQYYSGKALKPGVTVKYGTKVLKNNTDYTLSYKNNTNVGTATVTITGKGNYKFTKYVKFTISLKKNATYTVSKYQYKVTSTSGVVTLVKSTNTKATSITVGSTVKIGGKTCTISAIGDKVFRKHSKLTKITIGANVTSIGKQAFEYCGKLKSIVISSSKLKSVGSNAFKDIDKKAVIKVPKAKLKSYQKLLAKKGQKSTVKITK